MDYTNLSKEIRKNVLKMHYKSQEGHLGSALSIIDILTVLYFKVLNITPELKEDRDRFILSKGHAAAALYATLAAKGFFLEKELDSFCESGCKMAGHPTKGVIGVEASTGALGHGLPMGAGMALAAKMDKKDYRVFVLMSDGECQEGSNWEAILFAAHNKLNNLIAIIDYNKLQACGKTNEILNLEPFVEKWKAFGWEVGEVNGHDLNELEAALSGKKEKPYVVICNTIKGKGVSFMEGKLEWHYNHLDENTYKLAIKELE